MQKTLDRKIRAVLLYIDRVRTEKEICEIHGIVPRTFRRWVRAYRNGGIDNLRPGKRGTPRGTNSVPKRLQQNIVRLEQKHPSWGEGASKVPVRSALPLGNSTPHLYTPRQEILQ
ncbi:MAG: helix-turn-helix domain containing protein [Thaumarchaeota archaeon]|nr:helix-turn-helix domain containing protein [Nitrososphaerota archaeon]